MKLRVLVACEKYAKIREEFKAKGHDAWSCDIQDTVVPGNHFKDSIHHVLSNTMSWHWDIIIANPPCTFLCNSGVSHLYNNKNKSEGINQERWEKMEEAAIFFRSLLCANCDKICIENPIPHKYTLEIIGEKYTQIIQPWMFGHPEQKATCLWLKGLPKLKPTHNVYNEMIKLPDNKRQRLHYLSPGKNRGEKRSITYDGIAQAMANQWG